MELNVKERPMASGCRVHPTDFPGCGNCLGTPRTVRQQVEDIQEHTERIRAIGAEMADESPDLCRCGAEFDGECSRCNDEDEQEALGERDGEAADDEARFGV